MAEDVALPVPPPRLPPIGRRRWLVHGTWLLATFLTTTYVGGWHYVGFLSDFGQAPLDLTAADPAFWLGGLWFSLSVPKSRPIRSGARHRPRPARVVCLRRLLPRAARPSSRISAATVFSLTDQPSSRRSAVIRGEP